MSDDVKITRFGFIWHGVHFERVSDENDVLTLYISAPKLNGFLHVGLADYAGGMGLDVETTDEEARQRAIISQMDARKHACAYCRNEFRADKRGACASCGAPQG